MFPSWTCSNQPATHGAILSNQSIWSIISILFPSIFYTEIFKNYISSNIPSKVYCLHCPCLVHSESISLSLIHTHPHTLKFSTLATLLSWVSPHSPLFLSSMFFHLLFPSLDCSDSRLTAFCEVCLSARPFLFYKTALVHRTGHVTQGDVS